MDYNEPKLIDQKNIKSLTIYKEYDKYNMPIATMNLHIDKKFADNIIKNSKTATMIMAVYKYQLDNNAAIKQLYFKHEFSYLTDDDTNKTEDIDYAKTDSKDEDREDVYRILKLGLISKKLVDRNLSPNNATIYKSSMQNIIVDLLNIGEPLLIEPFTETELVEQLIIPPKESLSKTLDYLNTIRVFYNTGYRFFMDLDNIYLVSKSGKATLRNIDKYATIKFNLSDIGGKEEAILEGFRDDDKTKSYIVDVPTTDIKYGKDNITDKELNGFTAVIDASKTVQQSYLKNSRAFGGIFGVYQNIMNTMNAIKKVSSSVRQVVKNIHQTTDTIKGNFNQIVEQAKESKSVIDTVATQAEALLRELPKTALDGTAEVVGLDGVVRKSDTNIKDVLTNIIKHTVVMQTTSTNTVEKSEDKFGKFKEAYTGQIYHIENFGSLVGAISPINFTDNTAQLTKEVSKLPEKREQSKIHFKESMTDFNAEYSKYITSNEIIVNSLNDTPDKLFYVTKKDNTGKAIETHELDLRALKSNLPELVKNLDFSKMKLSDMKGFTEQMKNSLKLNANVGDGLKKQIAATREIPKDFSKQILEGANTYVKSLQDTKNIAIANTKNSIINTTKSLGALKSNLSSLYQSGSTAISGISDMSKVGTNGESMIDVALDLTDIVEDLGKRKLIRIPNDNMGLIKNFKHALELKSVYLSLSKQQLDNSIFNMNLKYLINNNTKEHKEDTTDYIMLSKIEVYTNQGERFLATTNMTFAKLPKNTAENAKKL
jgi:hypothetical protein